MPILDLKRNDTTISNGSALSYMKRKKEKISCLR